MRNTILGARIAIVIMLVAAVCFAADAAAPTPGQLGYDDTPMQPNGRWHIHDSKRPQPPVVTPAGGSAEPVAAPADATILIGAGNDFSAWQMMDGSPVTWA